MFSTSLQNLDRKSILIGLAAVLFVAVIWRFGAQVYANVRANLTTREETLQLKYHNLQRLVQNKDALTELNTSLKQYRSSLTDERLIPGSTKSLAQAQFQKMVKQLAEKNDINIRVTKMMDSTEFDRFNVMKMQISARSEIGAINSFLQAMKDSPRYIFVQELEIKRINPKENRYFYLNAQLIGLTEQ
jgi:hypothetical protein